MDRVRKIINEAPFGLMATCHRGEPRVRPMSFVLLEDGRLWSSTYRQSGKLREIAQNDRVEICFVGSNKVQVRITGQVRVDGGADKKRRLLQLNPRVTKHFPDEDAPSFVHLEVIPQRIRWKAPGYNEYVEVRN